MRKDCNSLKNRDDRFDTLKGFLIILVVFGHLLDQKVFFADRDMPIVDAIYACIYSFHMPAMVLISGYFSKQGETGPGYYRKLTRSYLIPFAVFDLLQWLVTSRKLNVLLTPRFSMWFLLSLFFWKLLLPAFPCCFLWALPSLRASPRLQPFCPFPEPSRFCPSSWLGIISGQSRSRSSAESRRFFRPWSCCSVWLWRFS